MKQLSLSWLALTLFAAGCTCAQLPEATFQCEPDGTCAQPGYTCGADQLCHATTARDAGSDAGLTDSGVPDAGEVDAGVDAGMDDAGTDAGMDDAGSDAGMDDAGMDAGTDAGQPDAGTDAGIDAGVMDAGTDAGIDAGVMDAGCTPGLGIDEPDPLGIDLNCDGFDGDLSRAAFADFANGSNSNDGLTRATPKKTLGAVLATGREQIYLASGASFPAASINEAVALFGGYQGSGAWPRGGSRSIISGSVIAAPADGGRVVLDFIDVNGSDGTAGQAAVAVTLINSAGAVLRDVDLNAGTGGPGANGAAAPAGLAGLAGDPGGDQGGPGGAGGLSRGCGDAGNTTAGFAGGAGASTTSGLGVDGLGGALKGFGAGPLFCDGGCVGFDGGSGLAGTDGVASNARPADPATPYFGTVVGNTWRGAVLVTWTPASPGTPGGGGGGGGGIIDELLTLLARGSGAGGGGSGGCGGFSGGAGESGGASIGLLLIDSSPTLHNVSISTTAGGRGGNGGAAGAGGLGGAGGAGGLPETVAAGIAGFGGPGGPGGHGGPGRVGPGGWGGPTIGVFCASGSAPTLDATTTWPNRGTTGAAGTGDPNGRAGASPTLTVGCP